MTPFSFPRRTSFAGFTGFLQADAENCPGNRIGLLVRRPVQDLTCPEQAPPSAKAASNVEASLHYGAGGCSFASATRAAYVASVNWNES